MRKLWVVLLCLSVIGCAYDDSIPAKVKSKARIPIQALVNREVYSMFEPQINCLYPIGYMVVMQKAREGYLLRPNNEDLGMNKGIAFLQTDKQIDQGEMFSLGFWAYYVGKLRYKTILGFDNEVYTFRLVDVNKNKKKFDELEKVD